MMKKCLYKTTVCNNNTFVYNNKLSKTVQMFIDIELINIIDINIK